ncbi:MAG TPA: endonuclease/exonuclease/phosphatase family protein [Pyrinomonadaceae bacterium]|jgi:endonuclease/exonuclease/phosphatase family metal-dependent hydrolase
MATSQRTPEGFFGSAAGEVEIGSFAPPGIARPERGSLVIASYNIRYGVGSFLITGSLCRRLGLTMPGRRPRLIERHLRRAAVALSDGERLPAVDIIALQEADRRTARAGGHHVAQELAAKLRMHYAHAAAAAIPGDEEPPAKQWYLDFEEHLTASGGGATGVALLSCLPFQKVARVDLPGGDCAWRPRLAIAATFRAGGQDIHLFNSHIDPHAELQQQLAQHTAVLDFAEQLTGPRILLGDFNTLSKRSCQQVRAALEARGYTTPFRTGEATWRAGLIRLHTDWIFLRGLEARRWGVARSLGVSDHWPVWVEIGLDDRRAAGQ